ncbi:HEXXH motif-containing protein [Actinoplanes octamycinicus]|uniref:HEXXH motif-containing protein n=1 Tax=Actinoplanes octamycinicus TaxID=135948 RepID=A0A7W7GZH4_9ACTN|nr:HEXXH motif domain-containing protein [Actinoplanes octamycinicus]MBB4741174.1 HEXXH motif-containing protein [Actinoplanes octamycinicus]GIE56081.1 HEXXH motif domain-containing protein [Actinoplanes octamycinicus]
MTGAAARSRHRFDPGHFEILAAGGGDGQVVARFWASERSWRLTVLLTLVEVCSAVPGVTGPLPSLDTTLDLLSQAYRADPGVCEDVLSQPQVGVWAAWTLRRAGEPRADRPLWTDLGYLHALAVACAVRAGVPFELAVPIRHGVAVVPTVGAASFPGPAGHARASSDGKVLALDDGTVTVHATAEDPGWRDPVRVEVEAGGLDLSVALLDHDAYRDLRRPSAPRPLAPEETRRWRALLGDAWRLLVREQPERAAGIAASLRCLAPVPRQAPYRQLSASGAEAFGGVLLSEPDDATQLAVTLVHEAQHHKLGALLHLFTLVEADPAVRYYAPWRDDPRPLDGLLQGVYAFAGITDFWRVHREFAAGREAALAHFEFALWRRQTFGAVRVLADSGKLTPHGSRFVGRLRERVAGWQDEPVPVELAEAAEGMALDHHAGWRASSIRVDPAAGDALVAAFRRGEPVPGAVLEATDRAVVKLPEVRWLDGRAVLLRHRLAGQEPGEIAGTSAADFDLVAGRVDAARAGYLGALARDSRDAHAWIGLGLTLDRRVDPGARALLGRPELLVAMAGAGADPVAVARWLGGGLSGELGEPRPGGWGL